MSKEIAERLKGLREMSDITAAEMAGVVGLTVTEYERYETGNLDFTFNFLHNCAKRMNIGITELVTGETPKLSAYNLTRAGGGMPIERRAGFNYRHLAPYLKDRLAEPFVVTAPYDVDAENKPISTSVHEGQEIDIILSGQLMISVDGHIEILSEGDSIYYDSGKPHGMIATGGKECKFIAIVVSVEKK